MSIDMLSLWIIENTKKSLISIFTYPQLVLHLNYLFEGVVA